MKVKVTKNTKLDEDFAHQCIRKAVDLLDRAEVHMDTYGNHENAKVYDDLAYSWVQVAKFASMREEHELTEQAVEAIRRARIDGNGQGALDA